MCTLSIIHFENSTVFTSNRDDRVDRSAVEFCNIESSNKILYYLKDPMKNGTWLAFTNKGEVAILLNGCDNKHIKEKHHVVSRGKIPIDFLKSNLSLNQFSKDYDFFNYEPFTLVIFKNEKIRELKWNGFIPKTKTVPVSNNGLLWSSVTLYDEATRDKRLKKYGEYFMNRPMNPDAIFKLLSTPSSDLLNDFFIQRANAKTLSTSQLNIGMNKILFKNVNHISTMENQLIKKNVQVAHR